MVKAGSLANLVVIAGLGIAVLGFTKAGGISALRGAGGGVAGFLKDITGGVIEPGPAFGPPLGVAEGVEQEGPPRPTPEGQGAVRDTRSEAERRAELEEAGGRSFVLPETKAFRALLPSQTLLLVRPGATGEALRESVFEARERGLSIGQITFTGLGTPTQLGRRGIEQGEEAGAF